MKPVLLGLLALLLAACGDSDAPATAPAEQQNASAEPALQAPLPPGSAEQLRSEWMRIEHPGWAAPVGSPVEAPVAPSGGLLSAQPQLAIVIDDVGHSYAKGRRLIDLPVPVALAILPQTRSAARLAEEAQAAGQTVMLHLPMENSAGLAIGPGGLHSGMLPDELLASLQSSLDSFAPIHGVNNHMGSRLTADRVAMDWVMGELQQRGLFFVDSRTTAQTQAAFAADAAGVRNLSRDVFLDNRREPEAIHQAFQRGLALAHKNGGAVLIGHPYPETLDYLERWLPGLADREGIQVVSVPTMLARKYAPIRDLSAVE